MPMLVAHGGFHALDWHSTRRAVSNGTGVEANPVMRWAAGSDVRLAAAKAAGAAGAVWALNRLACRHPKASVSTAVALNAFYGVAVGRNYGVSLSVAF